MTQTDSTNAELARRLALGVLPLPYCLSADSQTCGRGRRGRTWLDTEGALMMSIAFPVSGIDADAWPLISLAAALGVLDAAANYCSNSALKWPNDIVCVNNGDIKKLCGILCELVLTPAEDYCAVIGIGLNANCAEFPPALMQPATSLRVELGRSVDIFELRRRAAFSVIARLKALERDPAALIDEYSRHCVTLGKAVRATDLEGRTVAEGIAGRVLEDGRLVIDTASGEAVIDAADVSLRPQPDEDAVRIGSLEQQNIETAEQ